VAFLSLAVAVFTLILLAAAFACAAFQSAGVTLDWNWSICAMGAACGLYYLLTSRTAQPSPSRLTSALLAAFVAIAAFQLVPLPLNLVATLSPARAELARASALALGAMPRSITLSVAPQKTFGYVLTLVAYALVFLVLREIALVFRNRAYCWVPIWPLLAVAAAEAVLGISQSYAENGEGFARGTYVNRDHYAGLLELLLPFALLYPIAILYRERNLHESPARPAIKACCVLALGTVMLIAVILSESRMAFLATLASLFVGAGLAIGVRVLHIEPSFKASLWRKWVPIAMVAVVISLSFVFLPTDALISRFADLAKTETISADTRAQIWRESMGLAKAFPIFGCGLGGYESAFLRFKTVAPMNTVDFAHNDYLQVLAEMGIVGFTVGLLLLLLVLRSALRGALYGHSLDDRMMSVACVASLTAILIHSFADFNMYVPVNALAVAWIAGIAGVRLTGLRKRPAVRTAPAPAHAAVSSTGISLRGALGALTGETGTIAAQV
jgi:O-antigen ligase